jgi:hypothetical protein
MRKAMLVSQQKFGIECGLLTELTNYVADSLGEVYPEIRNRLKQVRSFYGVKLKESGSVIMMGTKTLLICFWLNKSNCPSMSGNLHFHVVFNF